MNSCNEIRAGARALLAKVGLAIVVPVGVVLPITPVLAAGDADTGQALYAVCQGCHGRRAEGNSALGTPRLAGLQDWYLTDQLRKFRNGMRGAAGNDHYGWQMAQVASTLPGRRAILDVVAYVGSLPTPPPAPATVVGDTDRGKDLYTACIQCHGSRGQGLKAAGDSLATYNPNSPRLAGQHDRYLVRQLRNFKSGIRGYHEGDKEGREMIGRIKILHSDQMIKDVVAYITILR